MRSARRSPRLAYAFLLGGALPFAAATWWSVVTPVITLVALMIGHGLIRMHRPAAWERGGRTGEGFELAGRSGITRLYCVV